MSNDNIEKRVIETTRKVLNIDNDKEIRANTKFMDDLGADSLDTVELVMALEEEFDCEIPDSDAANISTIKDVVDYIEKRL